MMSYLLLLSPLHAVVILAVLGPGEAGGQRGRTGSVQDGGPGELVPLPAALPLRLPRVQALLQGVWYTGDRKSSRISCLISSGRHPFVTSQSGTGTFKFVDTPTHHQTGVGSAEGCKQRAKYTYVLSGSLKKLVKCPRCDMTTLCWFLVLLVFSLWKILNQSFC